MIGGKYTPAEFLRLVVRFLVSYSLFLVQHVLQLLNCFGKRSFPFSVLL
jgi:hypothetical protein